MPMFWLCKYGKFWHHVTFNLTCFQMVQTVENMVMQRGHAPQVHGKAAKGSLSWKSEVLWRGWWWVLELCSYFFSPPTTSIDSDINSSPRGLNLGRESCVLRRRCACGAVISELYCCEQSPQQQQLTLAARPTLIWPNQQRSARQMMSSSSQKVNLKILANPGQQHASHHTRSCGIWQMPLALMSQKLPYHR